MTQYKDDVAKQKAKLKAEEDNNKVISWEFQRGAGSHFRKITYANSKVVTVDLNDKDCNPLVVMPTGSGKSHVIADFVLHMNEQKKQKTLIVSHVKEILFQNYEKLQDAWPYGDIGLYGNSLKSRDTDNDIIYAQLQSVWNKVDQLPLFDLLAIDEAHLVPKDGEGMYRSLVVALKERNPLMI